MRLRAAMHEASEQSQAHRALTSGLLRIGASTTPASYLLPEVVARFKQRHPGVDIRMVAGNTSEIIGKLHELDVAIVEGELSDHTLSNNLVRPWQNDEVVAIVPARHAWAQRDSVSLAELARQPLVMREQGSGVRNLLMQAFAGNNLQITGYLELAGVEGIKQAVRAGLGIGFVSQLSLGHEDGALQGIRIGRGLVRSIHIVLPAIGKPSRVTEAFLQAHRRTE
jgi:DNA-binding transcriptional LysR family regulator